MSAPLFLGLLLVCCSVHRGITQGDCSDLPSNSVLEGLIATNFKENDASTPPTITVNEVNYVCLMSGMFRDTFRGFSAVIRYDCVGIQCPQSNVSQFEFSCDNTGEWTDSVLGSTENLRTDVADASLTSPNRTDCSFCFSPTHTILTDNPGLISTYDNINHCLACDAACNEGDMKCFDFGSDSCCNFYDPLDNGRCLRECPPDRDTNNNFECTGVLRFSMSEYVFSEEDGEGSVTVEGTAGLTVRVVGGPNLNMADIRPSGTDINTMVTTPATISFNITNDEVAIEVDEVYPVVIIPNNPNVTVEQRVANIIIRDDVDTIEMGFASREFVRVEGDTRMVTVRVNGESIRDAIVLYLQEGASQQRLTVMAGDYNEQDMVFPDITNPDDEIALQDNRMFRLGLLPLEEFADDIDVGVIIGSDPTFADSNLTIVDDDVVTVSFDQPSYTVLESGSVMITLSLDHGIASNFFVEVRAAPNMSPPPLLAPSVPTDTYSLSFTVSDLLQSNSFTLTPVDDTVPNEPNEVVQLVFFSISDGRVEQGPTAELVIVDDDDLGDIGFSVPSYTFLENERIGRVTVNGPSNFPSTLSVQISGGPGRQPGAVVTSGADVDMQLTSFPAEVSFTITDDDAALEPVERYTLSLTPSDPSITISQAEAEIVIIDDDMITIGFPYAEKTFPASAVGNATLKIFGQAQQDFTINFIQEFGGTSQLSFVPGVYDNNFEFPLSIMAPENRIGDITFRIALVSLNDSVAVGGTVDTGDSDSPELVLFPEANITIIDDAIIVGFLDQEYTFLELGSNLPVVRIGKSGDLTSAFTVQLTAEPDSSPSPFIVPSAVPAELAGTVSFPPTAGDETDFALDLRNDNVALEDDEFVTLILSSPSTSRVRVGGTVNGVQYYPTARVTVQDDDLAMIGFRNEETTVDERRPFSINVDLFNDIVPGRSVTVSVMEQSRGNMQFVARSFALPTNSLEFSSTSRQLEVEPILTNDNIGLEDNEEIVITLVPVSDASQIVLNPVFANITITDDDIVTLGIEGAASRNVFEGDSTDVCVSKDIQTVRAVNFLLTPIPGSAEPEDFSPTAPQSRSLLGTSTNPLCLPFSAIDDSLSDGGETFSVVLTSSDNFPSGPRGLQVSRDRVDITILERIVTPPPTPGVDVEDTVIGDPLFTVPLPGSLGHLCYEIRGAADQFFNFISDECVSVNAHYTEHSPLPGETRVLHVINQIAIRTVDNSNNCIDILVDRNGCAASVDSETLTGSYNTGGVSVSMGDKRVVVGVPNCGELELEMEIVCETTNGVEMLRFEVMRGLNLRSTSHGLLGQFWNVSILTEEFTGVLNTPLTEGLVQVTLVSPTSTRTFPAWQQRKTWDNRKTCLYGGNQNGGKVYEVASDHDSLIEGVYTDYRTESEFSTQFKFSQFDSSRCS